MRILELKKASLPKIAMLLTGLAAAILAVAMSSQAAQATPNQGKNCAICHTASTSASTTATPSTTTPAAGATYTVAITLASNPTGGNSGYAIVPVAPDTQKTNGGNTGALLSYTATMTAPAAGGTYSYTVYTNMGSQSTGQTGSAVYKITVTGGSTTPPASIPATTPPPATAPPLSYPLVTGTLSVGSDPLDQIHGPFSMTTDKCGICHRVHTAKAPNLLAKGSPTNLGSQSTLCLSCHDGTGAKPNVRDQYGLARPVNDPVKREYYSHDAVGATPSTQHTQSQLNEFGSVDGAIAPLNRHSECADCHNSHKATVSTTRDATQNTDGWDASGRLTGVSGVSVVNGAAGTAPTYTFLNGVDDPTGDPLVDKLVTREYQLCFKCHSGFTTLPSNADVILKPSKYALDKAMEFNPANPSFHPVEAQGKNQTAKMALSLAGTSPYKLWDLTTTSTIRCLNCHASSATSGPNPPLPVVDPALPQPGGALVPHTSVNRGILLRPYRDRLLKTVSEVYAAKDFALCYACHAEEPFANETGVAASAKTNFRFHGLHVSGWELQGPGIGGTDIDTPGAGNGNAICAECHFRLHSTTNMVPQDVDGTRLVNFAPDVQPNSETTATKPLWKSTGEGKGTCSVTCHGYSHFRNYVTP